MDRGAGGAVVNVTLAGTWVGNVRPTDGLRRTEWDTAGGGRATFSAVVVLIAGAEEPGLEVVPSPASEGLEGVTPAVAGPGVVTVDGGEDICYGKGRRDRGTGDEGRRRPAAECIIGVSMRSALAMRKDHQAQARTASEAV